MHAIAYDTFALPPRLPDDRFGAYGVPLIACGALDWWWSLARDTA